MKFPGLHGMTVSTLLQKLWNRFWDEELTASSAQLSYYLLFSMFPFLLFLVALVPKLAPYFPFGEAIENGIDSLSRIMPPQGMYLIKERWKLPQMVTTNNNHLLITALAVACWMASRGTSAFRSGLNRVYHLKETRPVWKLILLELGVTISLFVLLIGALTVIVLGGKAGMWIATKFHIHPSFFLWIRWPVSTLLVVFSIDILLYVLPKHTKRKFRIISLGSMVSTALWLVATWGFTKYVENFGNYNLIYGSLGSVIILMTWFYLSGLIFLVGALIHSIVMEAPQGELSEEAKPSTSDT